MAAGLFGGPANTTYSENTAVLAATGNYNPASLRLAALIAIAISFFGKAIGVVETVPNCVLGGACIVLYGHDSSVGLRTLVENHVDFTKNRNLCIAAVMLVLAIGGAVIGGRPLASRASAWAFWRASAQPGAARSQKGGRRPGAPLSQGRRNRRGARLNPGRFRHTARCRLRAAPAALYTRERKWLLMAIEKVKEYLKTFGRDGDVQEFDVSSATVDWPLRALRTDPARIAKTISLYGDDGCLLSSLPGT